MSYFYFYFFSFCSSMSPVPDEINDYYIEVFWNIPNSVYSVPSSDHSVNHVSQGLLEKIQLL